MRILVIKDEHRIANSIKKGLEQESFAVDLAFDGTIGFDLASGEEYDVIVLDRLLLEFLESKFASNLERIKSRFRYSC